MASLSFRPSRRGHHFADMQMLSRPSLYLSNSQRIIHGPRFYLAQPFDGPRRAPIPHLGRPPPESIDWRGSL